MLSSQYVEDEITEGKASSKGPAGKHGVAQTPFSEGLDAFNCQSLWRLPQLLRATYPQSPHPSRTIHIQ